MMMSPTEPAALRRLSVDEVAAAVGEVPALSPAVRRVMDACDSLETTAQDVAEAILADQGLTANVLRLANSAHYGHPRRITTATDAVVLLGVSAVRSLAISSHTAQLLQRPLPGYAMGRGDLWRHSTSVAFVSRRLALETGAAAAEEAFIAGLLHDVGKVVLSDLMGPSFERMTRISHEQRLPMWRVEREVLGFDHAELGSRIAERWRFPGSLVEAIGMHHRPAEAEAATALAHCVHMADVTCLFIAAGVGADTVPFGIEPESPAAVGLTMRRLSELAAELQSILVRDPEVE